MSEDSQKLPDSVTINGVVIPDLSVNMIRSSLMDIGSESTQAPALPTGYQIRKYKPGDELLWLEIMRDAEKFFIVEDDLFEKQFGDELDHLTDRMFFIDWIAPDGSASTVGTATAWWKAAWTTEDKSSGTSVNRGEWAQVHWVAVRPAHQGKGLTKPIMDTVMQRMAQSHQRAMLGTSTGRIWALKVYLDLGFVPDEVELLNPEINSAWSQIQKVLMHPALQPIFE